MVHIAESTVGRRYAGWFIRNSEHAARVVDGIKASPLPPRAAPPVQKKSVDVPKVEGAPKTAGPKVAWGGVKVA